MLSTSKVMWMRPPTTWTHRANKNVSCLAARRPRTNSCCERSEPFFLIRFFSSAVFGAWLSLSPFVSSFHLFIAEKSEFRYGTKTAKRGRGDARAARRGLYGYFGFITLCLVVEIGKVTLSKMVIPLVYASLAGLGSARNINFMCDSLFWCVCVCGGCVHSVHFYYCWDVGKFRETFYGTTVDGWQAYTRGNKAARATQTLCALS